MAEAQGHPKTTPTNGHTRGPIAFFQEALAHGPDDFVGMTGASDSDLPWLIGVDARIDNRDELLSALGLSSACRISDEALIGLGFSRWGEKLIDRLLGDFAIAAWAPVQRHLILIRDPTGQRPLHYSVNERFVAFASMPQGLFAAGVDADVDAGRLASFAADGDPAGSASFFRDIARVEPGHIVRITRDGSRSRNYWHLPTRYLRLPTDQAYIDAYREQLDRAVNVRLRGAGPLVAAHLSAGLDSGAVTATAARLLAPQGGRVLAITSAPSAGFDGPVPYGRIADESGLAATVARCYANVEHLVVRSGDVSPLDHLSDDARLFAEPVGHPCNNVWWRESDRVARTRGASVMLTGENGNLTISAGSLAVLGDLVRTGRLTTWLREVVALRRRGGPRWRGLMASSFGPWVPGALWRMLARFSAGGATDAADQLLLAAAAPSSRTGKPDRHRTERELRWRTLRVADPGNFRKGAWLQWGIDERDPTADRRLIEFCFSLPPAQLLGHGRTRRLARAALADRLPAAVIDGVRGYQYADWYERIDRDRLAAVAREIATSPTAKSIFDTDALDGLIAAWPPGDWASMRTIGTYRIGVLRALAAGVFALNAER